MSPLHVSTATIQYCSFKHYVGLIVPQLGYFAYIEFCCYLS